MRGRRGKGAGDVMRGRSSSRASPGCTDGPIRKRVSGPEAPMRSPRAPAESATARAGRRRGARRTTTKTTGSKVLKYVARTTVAHRHFFSRPLLFCIPLRARATTTCCFPALAIALAFPPRPEPGARRRCHRVVYPAHHLTPLPSLVSSFSLKVPSSLAGPSSLVTSPRFLPSSLLLHLCLSLYPRLANPN